MSSMTQSPVSFTRNLASKPTASDLLRSSSNSICGVPLKVLGKSPIGAKRRDFNITARIGKVKHDYPWPADPDLDVKGGVLRHLSPFKPLKEKPKPVTLDFEKPLTDLQKKIIDVQKMANETGLDFDDQIILLENKYQQALKDLYTHLTPIQRVNIARHPNRPTFLDHIFNITEKFVELHGDRAGYDDPAIVTGLGTINGQSYMFMGQQKGRNTKENIKRNFGMPTPHGYRKALRMMHYADHHGFPIVTFIDTPGAYADPKSEALGQGEAIAHNLRTMFGLKVPIVSIVMGEGGSGGALAIACANKLLMLENAVFFVASPEACAAIVWKTGKETAKAAEKLRITATELTKLQIADGIIPEPLGGAHVDPYWTSQQIKKAIVEAMDQLTKMDTETLLKQRSQKFRKIGGFQEGDPLDRKRKFNVKKRKVSNVPISKTLEMEPKDDVKNTKLQVLKASKTSPEPPKIGIKEMIEKLKREIIYECDEAAKALGMKEKILMVREEVAKGRNSMDQPANSALNEKIKQLKGEFWKFLPSAPNYPSLKSKVLMLKKLYKPSPDLAKSTIEDKLKSVINRRFSKLLDLPAPKNKIESLKTEIGNSDSREEIESDFKNIFKPLGLQDVLVNRKTVAKIDVFGEEVNVIVGDVAKSYELRAKIELLKAMVEKAGNTPDEEPKSKIQALVMEIKQETVEATSSPESKERLERLAAEILEDIKYSVGSNGSLSKENTEDSQVIVNVENNRSFV
ncbi:Chromatin assembly factor 1 subunit p50 [Orobanche gracilis]